MADLDLLPYIEQARAENPKALLEADEVAMCLYRAAQLARRDGFDVGVLLKPGGSGGMCPVGRISLDIIVDIPDQQEYDAFGSADGENGAPGPAIPVWHKLPFKVGVPPSGASMDRVRRPPPLDVPIPVPTPTPIPPPNPNPDQPPAPSVDKVLERLDLLLAKLETIEKVQQSQKLDLVALREARSMTLTTKAWGGPGSGTLLKI